jgi:hypothetical protein
VFKEEVCEMNNNAKWKLWLQWWNEYKKLIPLGNDIRSSIDEKIAEITR